MQLKDLEPAVYFFLLTSLFTATLYMGELSVYKLNYKRLKMSQTFKIFNLLLNLILLLLLILVYKNLLAKQEQDEVIFCKLSKIC